MKWIEKQLYNIGLSIDTLIYNFTSMSYRVFSLVSGVSLFDENGNSIIETITNRIYVILGVVMLFVLAYEVLKAIADPDKLTASDDMSIKGIAKNSIIALAILAFLPVIFKYMAVLQNNIVKQNVIGNIILGSTTGTDEDYLDVAGVRISISIFSTFFHPTNEDMTSCQDLINDYAPKDYDGTSELDVDDLDVDSDDEDRVEMCAAYINAKNKAERNKKFKYFSKDDTLKDKVTDETVMDYSPLLGAVAGAIACYMFLSYAIDAGKRVAKLAFYEIIAPIPIICKIFKPEIFKKWLKDITQTYLELFLRLAIVFFVVYLISIIPDLDLFHRGDHTGGFIVVTFANCIIILGLLGFAKEAPKLIEDLLQIKIGELGIKKKLRENEYAQRALGMGAGAVMGGVGRFRERYNLEKNNNDVKHKFGRGVLSGLAGAAGGVLGGARRGLTGNYENGLGAGIRGAHQDNMEAGTRRDNRRAQGEDAQGNILPNLRGLNTIVGGVIGAKDSIVSGARTAWQTTTGQGQTANEAAKKVLSTLKTANNASYSSLPNNNDAEKVDEARKKLLEDILKGNVTDGKLLDRLKNAGMNDDGKCKIKNGKLQYDGQDITKEELVNKLYKSKIKDLRSTGLSKEEMINFANLDIQKLKTEYAKNAGSLSENERKELSIHIEKLESIQNAITSPDISDDGVSTQFSKLIETKGELSKSLDKLSNDINRNTQVTQESK